MNFAGCQSSVVLLLYSSAAVLLVVHGQSTTDDDDYIEMRKLIDAIDELRSDSAALRAELKAEQAKSAVAADTIADLGSQLAVSVDKIAKLESQSSVGNTNAEEQRGTTYTRWGRKVCENNATLLYKGYATGPVYTSSGSASNYLCLPEDPQWKTVISGDQSSGWIAGVEYELFPHNSVFSEVNNGGNSLANNPAPCAVCYASGRSSVLMIPARTQCPDGWTAEYHGYLASDHNTHKRTNYVCWDETPEVAVGGTAQNQALVYPVEVRCGSLPCSLYPNGKELTCIVCSK